MRRKIAAILAADIAGYSRLVAEDEEETLRRLKAYREVTDDFIAKAGGRIFNTAGDAVLAEFPSAVEAVRCAIDIQESLRTRNSAYPPSRQMSFRIGITIGDVVERDGDLLGDGVNIAARLEGLAAVGGICVSRSVYEQVANKLSVEFADMGAQQVKNIPTPVHAYMVGRQSETFQPKTVSAWAKVKQYGKNARNPAKVIVGQDLGANLAAAFDLRTLFEMTIALVALILLSAVPAVARQLLAARGVLELVAVALLYGIVVFGFASILKRRLQLDTMNCVAASLGFGVFSLIGRAFIPTLNYVGINGYEASYIGEYELSLFFGCVGASVALCKRLHGKTIFLTLILSALILCWRYALYDLRFGYYTPLWIPFPVVVAACLLAVPQGRISFLRDVAAIIAVWLMTCVLAAACYWSLVSANIILDISIQFSFYCFAVVIPTVLARPAFRFARPNLGLLSATPTTFDRTAKASLAVMGGIFIAAVMLSSTAISRCKQKYSFDACTSVIDSYRASVEDRISALDMRAREWLDGEKWNVSQAIADRTKLIELDSKNPARYVDRAKLWEKIGSYEQAIGDMESAIALQPTHAQFYKYRSDLWKKQDNDERALADLDQFVKLEPLAENFATRATYNVEKSRFAAAISDYSTAIKMAPKNVDYLTARAEVYEKSEKTEAAKSDYMSIAGIYDSKIAASPTAEAFIERAEIWEKLENFQKALADYTLAINLDPNHGFNFTRRYWLVQKISDEPDQIMKYLNQFVSREPTFAYNYQVRAEARDDEEIDKKLADYDQAVRLKPDETTFRFERAKLLEQKGKFADAIADYDRIIKTDAKDAKALFQRGKAKEKIKDQTSGADIAAAKAVDPEIDK